MKKILVLILFPFITQAQAPAGSKTLPDSLSENYAGQPKNRALLLIEDCRNKVISGQSSMSQLARLYSEDPGSAKNGGLILNVIRGVMDPVFETVAFSLKAGEVSPIFETQYGYHFIQLLQQNKEKESVDLRHILIMRK